MMIQFLPSFRRFASVASSLALASALTACLPTAPGGADLPPQAAVGTATAFGFSDCKARLLDGSPAIAVTFTQPLKRQQDWGKLLAATESKTSEGKDAKDPHPVPARWVLGDNPRVVYLPFVTPDRQYRITVDGAVAADAGGATLKSVAGAAFAPIECSVTSEAMPESFYFASKGTVLPAEQNGGLPIVTVNTPEVDVQFLRIEDAALPAFLEQVGGRREAKATAVGDDEGSEEGYYYGGYDDPSRRLKGTVAGYQLDQLREKSKSVYIGRFATDERRNRRNVSFIPVEGIKALKEPGVYVAVMNPPGRFGWDYQVTYFYVTDIGLHARRHPAQTDVFATSLKTGQALSGVELTLIDSAGKALSQVKTDGDGHAVFLGDVDKARAIVAKRGAELSLIALRDPALDVSEFDVGGHPSRPRKLLVYAGRDLYRPGESFHVSIVARDPDGKPLPAPGSSGTAPPLTVVLKKPDGEAFSTQLVRPHAKGQGFYAHALALPATAPTGRWLLEAKFDPAAKQADTSWAFQVEEFLPERMKLALTAPEAVLQGNAALTIDVQGDYLYGAPAAGNRLLASASSERQRIALPQQWPGFVFGDVDDDSAKKRQDLGENTLDDQGKAQVSVATDLAERHSPMRLRTALSLLESGGRPVVRSIERTWWPAPALIGLRPLFDRDIAPERALAEFELIRVNTLGQFAPTKGMQIKLVREERNWYWRYDDSRGWHSGYTSDEELVEARTVDLAARQKIALPVGYGRYRLELADPATGQTARYRFYAGWGAQDADDAGSRPDRVALKLEGAPYKAGASAALTITPPHDGEALVTVEGDKVLYSKRISVSAKGTKVEVPVDAAWARHDLYISVVAFRPGSQGDKVTPARALGLIHLPLARETRKLKVAISAPAKTQPETRVPVKIQVTDSAGQPLKGDVAGRAIVTLSAVDVGILNITRFATPDPFDFFFGKHRYSADALDLYGKLIEKMDGTVAKQRFGGDAQARDTQSLPRKVRLVDLFSGPLSLDAQGMATVPLDLPDFNGTLRLMAVVTLPDSYGSTDAEMVVAAPLVAELNLPRFIAPGDSATMAVDVTNLSGSAQTVKLDVSAQSPLRITGGAPAVTLADKQRTVLRYTIEAIEAHGLAPIDMTVSAGKLKIVRQAFLQVQPLTPSVREARRIRLEPGASTKLDTTLADGLWQGTAQVGLGVSTQPPIDVKDAVQGLLMYPYGCLEQTTSSAYPLVFIDEAGATAFGMKPLSREERAKRLDGAFGRLMGMQQPQGGFGLWSAASPYEAWLSAYVTSFLQDARDAGFAVPESLTAGANKGLLEQFQKAPGFQTEVSKDLLKDAAKDSNGRVKDHRVLETVRIAHQRLAEAAHTGYVLARDQKAPLATLRTLHDRYRGNAKSPLVLVHLGLALQLMGDPARAKVALDEALKLGYGLQPAAGDNSSYYNDWLGDYGSRLRDLALAYSLLHRHKVDLPQRENLVFELANEFDRRQYYSTQDRLALFLAARAASVGQGKPWALSTPTGPWTGTGAAQKTVDTAVFKKGMTVTNTGTDAVYLNLSVEGYPVKPLAPRDDRIKLERTWWTADGKAITSREFKTGDTVIVRLRTQANQRVRDALVVERVPAGFEVENLNLSQGAQASEFKIGGVEVAGAMSNAAIKHREYRDDRFVAAVDLSGQPLDLFYLLRVVTPGKYAVPAPFAEDMYRPDIRGVGRPEADIVVLDPRRK